MNLKFVNRMHSEALLRDKKWISSKSFNHLNVLNKVFDSVSFCPFYRYIWDKWKDLQRQGQVNHAFSLGGVVCIKLSENGSPTKLYQMNNIPDFPFLYCRSMMAVYDGYRTKKMRCELYLIIRKVVIFFTFNVSQGNDLNSILCFPWFWQIWASI